MAIIIKADMPKACITGKLPNYNYCFHFEKCDKACGGDERPSDCPIIGEIPDEHGRLVDKDAILDAYNKELYYWQESPRTAHDELVHIVQNAPTVVEATT